MPSSSHQNFIFLLREHPELALSLARAAGTPLPDPTHPGRLVVEASADIDVALQPGRSIRADLVLTERSDQGQAIAALGIEVQLHAERPDAAENAKTALRALLRTPLREPSRYVQIITSAIGPDAMNKILSKLPEDEREPLSDWERRGAAFVHGKEEGLEQGLEQGLAGLRATVLAILAARNVELVPRDRAWLDACASFEDLRDAAVRAATMAEHEPLRR